MSIEDARRALQPVFDGIVADSLLPEVEKPQVMARLLVTPAGRGVSPLRERFGEPAWLLSGVAVLLLFAAGVSAAGLMADSAVARVSEATPVQLNRVGPGYFATMGIPVMAGRACEPGDAAAPIEGGAINDRLARRLFGDANPIGQQARFVEGDRPFTIIGVVADSVHNSVREAPRQLVYICAGIWQGRNGVLFVRSAGLDADVLAAPVQQVWPSTRPSRCAESDAAPRGTLGVCANRNSIPIDCAAAARTRRALGTRRLSTSGC